MSEPAQDPNDPPQWRSYLMPGTDVLRTIAELTDPTAVAIFERIVSADGETALRPRILRTFCGLEPRNRP